MVLFLLQHSQEFGTIVNPERCALTRAGASHVSTADFPSPLRHSLADPDAFEVDPKFNRKVT